MKITNHATATWIAQAVERIALERLTAWRIGTKIRQDPCGLIVPSTTLQALGGWNCELDPETGTVG
jgi:hypothetical protein